MSLILSYCLIFCEKSFLRWCIAGNLLLLQKISLRPRESGLAARASPSAVAVDFPEASLSAIPSAYALLMTASVVVLCLVYLPADAVSVLAARADGSLSGFLLPATVSGSLCSANGGTDTNRLLRTCTDTYGQLRG